MGLLSGFNPLPVFLAFFFMQAAAHETPPSTILWAAPSILLAAVLIAWAAESAQYFIAQGFALAILAWLQTLPEFAVEAVYAWSQRKDLLLANLTGALRLLTGVGWPMIYFTAAVFHRKRHRKPMHKIQLSEHHAVEVMGLVGPLVYMAIVSAKGSLTIIDGGVLILLYSAYLWVLAKLPAEGARIRRRVGTGAAFCSEVATRATDRADHGNVRGGGTLIYVSAHPFATSLQSLAVLIGVPVFVFVQWVAPLVSEFPEFASTFYWAKTVVRAPMSLMNMVSSNINQWTLLTAMLPIVYSMSIGTPTPITFDEQQRVEILMTLGQAVVGMLFLMNMELRWWEAAVLFGMFALPFGHPVLAKPVTVAYFVYAGFEMFRMINGKREPKAPLLFVKIWREHVSKTK
jgi:cation:H+ antiporter